MQGITFPGDRRAVLKEFPDPLPGPGEVVVRMRASGMCGSDLHFYRGSASFGGGADTVQGHEPCGDVHAVGAGVPREKAAVGDRVMIHHYWGCETCEHCRSGWPQMCDGGDVRIPCINEPGGHAPYMVVPVRTLLPLPDKLSYKAGAAIGCGTGTAWGGLKRLGDVGGTTLVVLGQGPVGLSGTMLASALGARVIAVDINDTRLDRAREFGASEVVNSAEADIREAVLDLTGGRGANAVLETSGVANADALKVLGKWGRACFIGLPGPIEFKTEDVYKNQWTLMTSWTLSSIEQRRCADFIAARDLPVDRLFTRSWSLDQAAEAYEWFDRQTDGKGVFEF
ncbi:zinc-dependent alcohol dehydrogenase family protein [Streptomyces cinereoruber]|uniref:2-deoxy-scyllo-inosamine dehydrogenase n=1 Tax=Streptomyces cinereoruber TaxID=67260 RepID=A0ABX6BQB8_9ACTN|nr:zinc-binding dehydrogenase [Streptomyces cinereoruber]MBY8819240.1 zinc-binding dehydrogenase [Streptomyces cinereoruber]QEV36016.1 iditol 2-dehydrogenase [Streptomyces cinereoruber]